MARKTSFEERLAKLAADNETPQQPAAPARAALPWGTILARTLVPFCGLVALGFAVVVMMTSDGPEGRIFSNPFDLAGSIKANMTEDEIAQMYSDPDINRAVRNAPDPKTEEMMRLLLSH